MANYDRAARYLIREGPVGFFFWLSQRFVQAWHFRGWLDTSAPGQPDEAARVCDLVAEFENVADPTRRCLLDIEAQGAPARGHAGAVGRIRLSAGANGVTAADAVANIKS